MSGPGFAGNIPCVYDLNLGPVWFHKYAEDMAANCSPASMAVIKRQVYGDITRDVVEANSLAGELLQEAMPRPDVIEGITSFLEKRPPQFPSLRPTDA